jgi:outer membrane protein assembly factor BamB
MSFTIGETGGDSFTVQARHARSGTLAWKRTFPGDPALATADGVLYLGSGNGTLQAIAATTGRPLWSHRLAAPAADIAVSGSTVSALDSDGGVYALQA